MKVFAQLFVFLFIPSLLSWLGPLPPEHPVPELITALVLAWLTCFIYLFVESRKEKAKA